MSRGVRRLSTPSLVQRGMSLGLLCVDRIGCCAFRRPIDLLAHGHGPGRPERIRWKACWNDRVTCAGPRTVTLHFSPKTDFPRIAFRAFQRASAGPGRLGLPARKDASVAARVHVQLPENPPLLVHVPLPALQVEFVPM